MDCHCANSVLSDRKLSHAQEPNEAFFFSILRYSFIISYIGWQAEVPEESSVKATQICTKCIYMHIYITLDGVLNPVVIKIYIYVRLILYIESVSSQYANKRLRKRTRRKWTIRRCSSTEMIRAQSFFPYINFVHLLKHYYYHKDLTIFRSFTPFR